MRFCRCEGMAERKTLWLGKIDAAVGAIGIMSVCAVHTGRLAGPNTLSVQRQCFGQYAIQGLRRSCEAYVSEEAEFFVVKVEIIRKVSTVSSPNDFGKSRV